MYFHAHAHMYSALVAHICISIVYLLAGARAQAQKKEAKALQAERLTALARIEELGAALVTLETQISDHQRVPPPLPSSHLPLPSHSSPNGAHVPMYFPFRPNIDPCKLLPPLCPPL